MSRILALVFSSILLFSTSAMAQTHAAHEHGVATLDLAVSGSTFEVDLDGPLANFISFEHEPSTEAQKTEVAEMVAKLAKADELFKAPAEAKCGVKSVSLSSEKIPAELFGQYASKEEPGHGHEAEAGHGHDHGHDHGDEAGHGHDHGHDHGDEAGHGHDHGHEGEEAGAEHGDLEAAYVFECADAAKLTGLEIGLFGVFPSLLEVEARVVSDKGQSAQELTPSGNLLKW